VPIARRLLPLIFLLVCSLAEAAGVTLMVYNVENLFDDKRDGSEFPEFDPGRGSWNTESYRLRLRTIAEVVRRAFAGGPDILVLQEVENENALRALADSGLKDMGYSRAVMVPKKGLATNIGVLTRLPVSRVHAYHVGRWNRTTVRDVVEVEIEKGGHTLHLFDNHWKSKTGGARETESSRLASARIVIGRVREILAEDPAADIVVAGDMNENSDEFIRSGRRYQTALIPADAGASPAYSAASIFLTGTGSEAGIRGDRLVLYDPWFELPEGARGSYRYGRTWETFDHILLSPGLFDGKGFSYRPGSFSVQRDSFLLTEKGTPRKWEGFKSRGGYSDHLPLRMKLDFRN
jgi:endonuclease/exonuclease/phosphatase family metal-dependent hydrolase